MNAAVVERNYLNNGCFALQLSKSWSHRVLVIEKSGF
jgi:hypothetical protein